jgi:hypothetical protein
VRMSNAHTTLVGDIEVALSEFDDVLVSRNPSGKARYGDARVPYGAFAPGAPDLLVVNRGRLVAIEVKTGAAVQGSDQKQCQRKLERFGVRYIVARSVSEAVEAVERVRAT